MNDSVDPNAVLHEAADLAGQGRYEEALARHLWFHHHALEVEEALYGVRLSYALSDWVELGMVYPPALQELRAVRDAKERALSEGAGSRELFHDVVAINDHLGEAARTVELFRLMDRDFRELASECYRVAEPALV